MENEVNLLLEDLKKELVKKYNSVVIRKEGDPAYWIITIEILPSLRFNWQFEYGRCHASKKMLPPCEWCIKEFEEHLSKMKLRYGII